VDSSCGDLNRVFRIAAATRCVSFWYPRGAPMIENREFELKLTLDKEEFDRLIAHPRLSDPQCTRSENFSNPPTIIPPIFGSVGNR
jgi:hypothetical protein